MSEQPPGRVAYEAYWTALGKEPFPFDHAAVRPAAWEAAAQAVATHIGAPPQGGVAISPEASPEQPVYRKLHQDDDDSKTRMFMITCDEGWRSSIVCDSVYEHVADWLLGILGRTPYASTEHIATELGAESAREALDAQTLHDSPGSDL